MIATPANTHEGKVVSVAGDKLTTTCNQGKEHCHTMTKDAKVTCDGQASKAADLKAGTNVRVTTKKDDKNVAIGVDSGKHISGAASKA
jgi:class 3 adenylate cyclase